MLPGAPAADVLFGKDALAPAPGSAVAAVEARAGHAAFANVLSPVSGTLCGDSDDDRTLSFAAAAAKAGQSGVADLLLETRR